MSLELPDQILERFSSSSRLLKDLGRYHYFQKQIKLIHFYFLKASMMYTYSNFNNKDIFEITFLPVIDFRYLHQNYQPY